jgi:hypothetical protein
MNYRFSLLICLLCVTIRPVFAQNLDAALGKLGANPPEKLYIQYDKEYYVSGETIFFKAYLLRDGKPSGISNNLFLQLTDVNGAVVANKKFPVLGAVAKGTIDIPDSLPQGNYYIRALTPYMLNDDAAFMYRKNIFVFRPGSASSTSSANQVVSVQFFPESGELVDGILTAVAFKSVDQDGIPVDVTGVIRTSDGTTIAPFNSYHDGIGKVSFKPQAGKSYIADVETKAGKRTYNLPEVKPSGINLKITDEKGGKKFQILRSEKDKAMFNKIRLVAVMNNQVVNDYDISFEDYPSIIGHLLTDSLPSGILHLTLFNNDGIPIAERLSFVNNHEYASGVNVNAKFINTKRSANAIELNFDEAIQRSCSVAVTDASGGSFNDQDNIWSRFLLTSDLKGYVYNPAWYFENGSDSAKQALDNLMLTHGWTRFSWTKILSDQFKANEISIKDEPFLSVSGRVMDEKNKEALTGGQLNIYLEAEDSSSLNYEVPVDGSGYFHLDSVLFYGNGKLYYAYVDPKGKVKNAIVVLDAHPLTNNAAIIPQNFFASMIRQHAERVQAKSDIDTRYNYVKSRLDEVKELERVTVQSKSNKKPEDIVNEKYTNGVFRSPGKVNLDNINEPSNDRSMNAVDYIKNRIPQVEIQGGKFVNRKNVSLMSGQKWPIGVFINEVPSDIFQLRLLRTQDIALVKFYEAGFVGVGSSFPGGALAVYTKEKDKNEEKPEKLSFVDYQGYSIIKQFYQPDYNNPNLKPPSDNRTTLYWNPDIYTDAESKTMKLDFFNNDFSKRIKVVVEGFDANGKLVHVEKFLE